MPFFRRGKQLQEDMLQAQEKIVAEKCLLQLIESIADNLLVLDRNGKIVRANLATLELLGYENQELKEKSLNKILELKGSNLSNKELNLADIFQQKVVKEQEGYFKTKSGQKVPVNFSSSVLFNADTEAVLILARDMRKIQNLLSNLENSKKDVEKTCLASINMMEDLTESKKQLEQSKQELENFSKNLERKVQERTFELTLLYDVSTTISYILDYQQLLKLVMESLLKVVKYDVCTSLLFTNDNATITFKPAHAQCEKFIPELKNKIIAYASTFAGEDMGRKKIETFLLPALQPEADADFANQSINSVFNAPFIVGGKTLGVLSVASTKEKAFGEEQIRFIYTIANHTSNALERLQALIKAEKSKMESMVESMMEGVVMIDEQGEVAIINPRARYMLGLEEIEQVGQPLLFERMGLDLSQDIKRSISQGILISKEIFLPPEHKEILKCDIAPVKGQGNKSIGVGIILRDITKEKEVDRMKNDFISTVSHELRTPLAIIKEGVGLIVERIAGDINEKQEKILHAAAENLDRLAKIIENLLDVSKIEAGKVGLDRSQVNLSVLVRKVLLNFERRIKDKNLELKTSGLDKDINIYADGDRIVQVFTNLIGNALKFVEKGFVEIDLKETADYVECVVADSGIGIAEEDLPRVFSKFEQFNRLHGAGEKGAGLGLSIAKAIVEMHRGKIRVESKLGVGTKFIFTIPKYTVEKLFKEYVYDGVKDAMKKDKKLTIACLGIDKFEEIQDKEGVKKAAFTLKKMAQLMESSVRDTDLVLVDEQGKIYIILSGCRREDCQIVKDKLNAIVDKYFNYTKKKQPVVLRIGMATYPDDAASADKLLAKMKEHQD
ncbi:MAG: ATP-binding protein [Pseudomonadota bacterium]